MTTCAKEQNRAETPNNEGFALISNGKLLQLYTAMLKCRMIDRQVRTLVEPGKLTRGNDARTGHEATLVGAAIDLLPDDAVASSPSNFLVNFIKGLRLESIFTNLPARAAGREFTGNQLTAATRMALTNKKTRNGKIVAVFRNGEATSMEPWLQALDLAGVDQLPMLFVSYSTEPAEPENRIAQAGVEQITEQPHGFPSIAVDGNDVVAVYRVATEAIAHARKGNGPTLIECKAERSQAYDPILNMQNYLTRKGLFSPAIERKVTAAFTKELDAAIESTKASQLAQAAVTSPDR